MSHNQSNPTNLFINSSSTDLSTVDLDDYQFRIYSNKSPTRTDEELNEDSAAIFRFDHENLIAIVADGVGGHSRGDQASRILIETFVDEINKKSNKLISVREFILNSIDLANKNIQELKLGSATTLVLCHINKNNARIYHIGDSEGFIIGDRGKLKYKTISHSPTGHGIEAGLIDPDQLDHPDRHLISNVIGASDMRIEIGPIHELSKRDHIILCTDGLTDNLPLSDIMNMTQTSSFDALCDSLSLEIQNRFSSEKENKVKFDDTTIITIRNTSSTQESSSE